MRDREGNVGKSEQNWVIILDYFNLLQKERLWKRYKENEDLEVIP